MATAYKISFQKGKGKTAKRYSILWVGPQNNSMWSGIRDEIVKLGGLTSSAKVEQTFTAEEAEKKVRCSRCSQRYRPINISK